MKIPYDIDEISRQKVWKKENEEILEYVRMGLKQKQIAEKMGVTQAAISYKMKRIPKQELEKAKKVVWKREKAKILEYESQGLNQAQIARKMGVTPATICHKMKKIIKEGVEVVEEVEEVEEKFPKEDEVDLAQTVEPRKKSRKNGDMYEEIREKLLNRTITKKDIENYKDSLEKNIRTITVEEIGLLVKIYIGTGQSNRAVDFLNSMIRRSCLTDPELDKLKKMKESAKEMQKIQYVRKRLKENISTKEIAENLGINEIEVIRIKNQIKAKEQKER